MKLKWLPFLTIALNISLTSAQQTADFESFNLPQDTVMWGKNGEDYYTSGGALFYIDYDDLGGFEVWEGFAISTVTDTTDGTFSNQFASVTGTGANQSNTYATCYSYLADNGVRIQLLDSIIGDSVLGTYITNSKWAAYEMLNGSAFAKKFGGVTGDDADYFKLTFFGFDRNGELTDSVEFFLADFRFADSDSDYVVTDWRWVDLRALGQVTKVETKLRSTDVGAFGMNTPAYFCLDNFTTLPVSFVVGHATIASNSVSGFVFSNGQLNWLNSTQKPTQLEIFNLTGQKVWLGANWNTNLNTQFLNGVYILRYQHDNLWFTQKISMF